MPRDIALPEIDVLVPVAPKDTRNVAACIGHLLRHSRNPIRAIHLVAPASLPANVPTPAALSRDIPIVWIDEAALEPSRAQVEAALAEAGCRHENASWYFQQLTKLSCFRAVPRANRHLLVLDADYTFVADIEFVNASGQSLLPMGYPLHWNLETRDHVVPEEHTALASAARLVPGWATVDAYSGMQHHMVFDRTIVDELIRRVERHHGLPFWKAFLATADASKWTGASEYVLYRHFAAAAFPERVVSRHVGAIDVIQSAKTAAFDLADVLAAPRRHGVQAVGCHSFLDYEQRLATMDYIPESLRSRLVASSRPLMLDLDDGRLRIESAITPLSLWGAQPDGHVSLG
ncbi:DUF6492 family protein [Pendulispora brunnea]|uniref:DUF6492 family protein n=1 Tax=Pendulispora brunnea TaxID=2905690 RepID=A0ABZ2KB64_9BACT